MKKYLSSKKLIYENEPLPQEQNIIEKLYIAAEKMFRKINLLKILLLIIGIYIYHYVNNIYIFYFIFILSIISLCFHKNDFKTVRKILRYEL